MKSRFIDRLLPSPRTQRRLQRIGAGAISVIGYPFRLVFGLARAIAHVIASWWDSRNLRYLLQGLPALVLSIGLVVVAAMIFFQDRSALAQEYRQQGEKFLYEAIQKGQANIDNKAPLAYSQTYIKRLSRLQPGDETSFRMAETYMVQRKPEAAESIFKSLAPRADKTGYGPAHFEVAVRLWIKRQKPEDIVAIVQHLKRAVAYNKEPWTAKANALLYEIYRGQNRADEAEAALVAAVRGMGDREPQLRLKLAQWYLTNGKNDPAERQVESAIVTYERRFGDNPDDPGSRVGLLECLRFSANLKSARGDYKKAKEEFERSKALSLQGMELVPNTPLAQQYAFTYVRTLISQYDFWPVNDPNFTAAQRFALLEQAATRMPADIEVLRRLSALIRATGAEGKLANDTFRAVVDSNTQAAGLAHLFLGIEAFKAGQVNEAKYHWEKAFELMDGAPLIANNLAWVLAFHDRPDLERALSLIDAALLKETRPEYHGTKGHILAKMGKYREALPELERAKPAFEKDYQQGPVLWKQLALCYEKLDMPEEAKHAKEKVDFMEAQFKKGIRGAPAGGATSSGPAGPLPTDQKDPAVPQAPKP